MTMVAEIPSPTEVDAIHERRFPVIEIFGPTIQGEGPEVGQRVSFVRFGGCDYRCIWCDTDIAVLPALIKAGGSMLTAVEISNALVDLQAGVPLILLSGGNPGLFDLGELIDMLHGRSWRVSIETQGSVWKEWMRRLDQIVVSPKPPSAGYGGTKTWNEITAFVSSWSGRGLGLPDQVYRPPMTFKVPCFDEGDVTFAGEVADTFPQVPMFLSVVTRSGGLDGTFAGGERDTERDLLQRYEQIIEFTHKNPSLREARIIPQLHYLIWGAERGR